ncbi:MAG: ShlB/FhaC/HecB family hemolysin secretion/activation protein [Pseudomonadales bacterium]
MLLKLAPETVRLRRMAKAFAAGELSEAEYRSARRAIIDNFSEVPPEDDNTRPRWAEAETLPRLEVEQTMSRMTLDGKPGGYGSRRWLWLLALAGVLGAALLGLPTTWAAGPEVPPVSQREPDPASSPRLPVRQVQVEWGAADRGNLPAGRLAALQARADQALEAQQARNLPGPHGFTASELEELARFLNVLGVHQGDRTLDVADARDLGALIRDQKQRRGVSVAELEEIAREVQSALREQGYFLAVAYLPAQPLVDGLVRMEVLPGRLGDIVIEGGELGFATGAFSDLVGQPLTLSGVTSRLQALNALPGVTAQASFGTGSEVGETRLRLDVLERRRWVAGVRVDNHGDDLTGDQQFGLSASWLSPRGVGDRLNVGALLTADPANQTYGYLEYDTPVGAGYRLAASIANNDFTWDDPRGFEGRGLMFDVAVRRSLMQARSAGLTLVLAAARHSLEWDDIDQYDGVDQDITLGGLGVLAHRVWDGPQIATDLAAKLSMGRVDGDRFAEQGSTFWLFELDADAWMPVSLPLLPDGQKLRVRLAGQWSDGLLPATRRFALGGAYRVRGFDRGEFLADRGLLLGLEARAPVQLGELLLFSETAYGDDLAEQGGRWAHLTTVGLGWEAQLLPGLSSRFSWAIPVAAKGSGDIDDDGSRLYWSLRYEH